MPVRRSASGGKAAKDPAYARDLVAAGMDVAEITSAHKGPRFRSMMISNIREAAPEMGLQGVTTSRDA